MNKIIDVFKPKATLGQYWYSTTVQGVTPKAPELYDPFCICIKVALIKKEGPYMSTMHTCDMHADHNNKTLLNIE